MIKDLREILWTAFDNWGHDETASGENALPQMELRLCSAIDEWYSETSHLFNGKSTKELYMFIESLKKTSKCFVSTCTEGLRAETLCRKYVDDFIKDLLEIAVDVTQYANDTLNTVGIEQTLETPQYTHYRSWIRKSVMVGIFSAN